MSFNKVPKYVLDFLEKNGKRYYSLPSPTYIIPGEIGTCFDTCVLNALKYPQLKYVEGIAMNPHTGEYLLHAWLTEDGEHAYDPTWRAVLANKQVPIPTVYFGFEMDTNLVIDFMRSTKYCGVFANHARDFTRSENIFGEQLGENPILKGDIPV